MDLHFFCKLAQLITSFRLVVIAGRYLQPHFSQGCAWGCLSRTPNSLGLFFPAPTPFTVAIIVMIVTISLIKVKPLSRN